MSGVKDDSTVIWLSAVVAFVNFIFTLAGVYLVEKVGRRVLTLSSFTGNTYYPKHIIGKKNMTLTIYFNFYYLIYGTGIECL